MATSDLWPATTESPWQAGRHLLRFRIHGLLGPLLLLSLACARPFPVEQLEYGMTAEAMRDQFGEPAAIETESVGAEACWTYWNEKQDWMNTVLLSWTIAFVPFLALAPDLRWNLVFVNRVPVIVRLDQEKLVRWDAFQVYKFTGPSGIEYGYEASATGFPGPQHYIAPGVNSTTVYPDHDICSWAYAQTLTAVSPGSIGYVARNHVSLWAQPDQPRERIAYLDAGEPVRVLAEQDQWCHVEDESAGRGWLACVFLTAIDPN